VVTHGEVFRAGSWPRDPFSLSITPELAGWAYSGIHLLELGAGKHVSFRFERDEALLVPLSGGARVRVDGRPMTLRGRASVFAGSTDRIYAPPGADLELSSDAPARIAVCTARADAVHAVAHLPADRVSWSLRGTGALSRQVVDLANAQLCPADRLIVCEVYTPAGNTSSAPPHKHDTSGPEETELEEIYYFELSGLGLARHRTTASDDRPIDVDADVASGDVALVPYGWHGPTTAPPRAILYYLNVMAGPVRAWRVTFHPTAGPRPDPEAPVDPRLPLFTPEGAG
jgi:5-deoxy-glucuronate isomerase